MFPSGEFSEGVAVTDQQMPKAGRVPVDLSAKPLFPRRDSSPEVPGFSFLFGTSEPFMSNINAQYIDLKEIFFSLYLWGINRLREFEILGKLKQGEAYKRVQPFSLRISSRNRLFGDVTNPTDLLAPSVRACRHGGLG